MQDAQVTSTLKAPALDPVAQYAKDLLALRSFLDGAQYHTALRAMELGRRFHTGMRKDNVTPNFAHQVYIANYIRTLLPGVLHKEETLAAVFLHDLCEDHDISFESIADKFGAQIGRSTFLLTKKHRGVIVPYDVYFGRMAEDPIASLVKPADRAHNIYTMHAAGWTGEKQAKYAADIESWFFPLIKAARAEFPEQKPAYENVKTLLKVQCSHIRLNLENCESYEGRLKVAGEATGGLRR